MSDQSGPPNVRVDLSSIEFEEVEGMVLVLRAHEAQEIAKRCLHGQSFGFSREDLEALREIIENEREEAKIGAPGVSPAVIDRLDSIASRIAALLPPVSDQTP